MTGIIERFVSDDSGQDLAEYGIALAVIGVIAAAAAIVIATDVGSLWSRAQSVIDSAATAS
jgi:Flp pilus assembly pilin Flp